jgi:ABC-type sugar transport system permease subunit
MATTILPSERPAAPALTAMAAWHALLCVALIGGGAMLLGQPGTIVTTVAALAMLALGVISGAAVPFVLRRNHRGRSLSLLVNYVCLLGCVIGALQSLDLFNSLDDLGAYLYKGWPDGAQQALFFGWPYALLLAFGLSYFAATYEKNDKPVPPARRSLGRLLMIVTGVGFLLSIGLVTFVASLAGKFVAGVTPIAFTLGILAFGFAIWTMWKSASAAAMGARNFHSERLNGWLFLSPNFLGFLIFFAGPLLFSLYSSFTNSDGLGQRDWIGLTNYINALTVSMHRLTDAKQLAREVIDINVMSEVTRFTLFGNTFLLAAKDKLFWLSLRNTLMFCIFAVPLSVVPALVLANLLNSKLPGMRFFRTLYFLPSVAAVVGVSLVWQWMYNSQVGWINYLIKSTIETINGIFGTTIADPQIRWLADTDYALFAVIIVFVWQWLGYNTVLFLAGLQTIPRDLYEAATVDGANERRQFWSITLPMLTPTTFFVLTTMLINAMQVFEQVFIMTSGSAGGGPDNATLTMVLNLYQNGFQSFRQGYASALAWILFIVIFIFTLLQQRAQRRASTAYDL